MKMTGGMILAMVAVASVVQAESAIDRSAMSDNYWSIWNDNVQKRIDADIEKYRKADGAFEVPAPDGTDVKVEQISHAFQFGSHIFNFDQLGRDDWNDIYKETFTNLWNAATVPFYWSEMEPEMGSVRYGVGSSEEL